MGEKLWQCLGHKDKMCKLLSLPYDADVIVLNADIKLQQQWWALQSDKVAKVLDLDSLNDWTPRVDLIEQFISFVPCTNKKIVHFGKWVHEVVTSSNDGQV